MQSIRKRIEKAGFTIPEFLNFVKENGRFVAMDKIDFKTYDRFLKFLVEETNDPNFGVSPTIAHPRPDNRPTDIKLLQKYQKKISLLRSLALARRRGKRLDREIEELERQFQEEIEAWGIGGQSEVFEPCELRIQV
jgi:hypothetical protein